MPGGVKEFDSAQDDLFARRVTRLEAITTSLRGLRRDMAQCKTTERQQKADIYQANLNVSHGERQGIASAQTAPIALEILTLQAEIDVLEDERQMLALLIQFVA